jgi:protein TonB
MTDTLKGRFILAGLLALILHAVGLSLHLHQKKVTTLPAPLSVQRIAVSLGARPVTPDKPKEPEPLPEEIPLPPEPKPLPEPVLVPEKLAPRSRKIVTKPVVKPQPPRRQTVAPPASMSPVPQESDDKDTKETAARVIQKASPLYQVNPPPKYPRLARRRGLEGIVILKAFIGTDGRVKSLSIFKSSGHSILDKAALKAVQCWQFSPGVIDGRPEEMQVKVPVRFQLNKR